MTQSPRLNGEWEISRAEPSTLWRKFSEPAFHEFPLPADPRPHQISRAMRFAEVKEEAEGRGHVAKRIARLIPQDQRDHKPCNLT